MKFCENTDKQTHTQTHKQTDRQTDMGITIPRPPPMGGEVIMHSDFQVFGDLGFDDCNNMCMIPLHSFTSKMFGFYRKSRSFLSSQ